MRSVKEFPKKGDILDLAVKCDLVSKRVPGSRTMETRLDREERMRRHIFP